MMKGTSIHEMGSCDFAHRHQSVQRFWRRMTVFGYLNGWNSALEADEQKKINVLVHQAFVPQFTSWRWSRISRDTEITCSLGICNSLPLAYLLLIPNLALQPKTHPVCQGFLLTLLLSLSSFWFNNFFLMFILESLKYLCSTMQYCWIPKDLVSFSRIMTSSTSWSLVMQLWGQLHTRNLVPNIIIFNVAMGIARENSAWSLGC